MKYFVITFYLLFATLTSIAQEKSSGRDSKNNKGSIDDSASVSFAIVEKVPIYPGCENLSKDESRSCFSKNIQNLVVDNFNFSLPNELGLPKGKNRSIITFTINKSGGIENINVTANHPRIKDEMERIMYLLPKIKPGSQRGKPVSVRYGFPFTINVE